MPLVKHSIIKILTYSHPISYFILYPLPINDNAEFAMKTELLNGNLMSTKLFNLEINRPPLCPNLSFFMHFLRKNLAK